MPRDSQCHLVKKYVIPSQNTVFGGGAGNSLRKKCESFSYSHVGINVVSFNLKTRPGDCTPHKDRDISEANDEFLMCAFENCDCSSLYEGKTKKVRCSRGKHLTYIALFLFFRIKT